MNIDIQIPDSFQELFEPQITGKRYTYKIYYGGRSGCKSHSFARALLILGQQNKLRILCLREYYNSIADSVKSLLDDLIDLYDLGDFYTSIKNTIVGKNGTNFLFGGLKINNKNIKGKEKIDIAWCEESETISQESWDLLIPTIIRNEKSEIWISFNPYLKTDPVMNLINTGREDIFDKKVTFRDNPFFTEKEVVEMEYCKTHDYDKFLWIWEGDCLTISEAAVFKDKIEIKDFDTPDDAVFYLGLDFGFSVDPIAFLRCFIDHENRLLYIDKGKMKVGVEIDDTSAFLESIIPDCKKHMIIADGARPEIISYLDKRKFKIRRAIKGKDSVIEGVEFIKNYTVIIHSSLKDISREFTMYSYKTDPKTGFILPVLQDKDNNSVDALRYAVEPLRNPRYKSIVPPPYNYQTGR